MWGWDGDGNSIMSNHIMYYLVKHCYRGEMSDLFAPEEEIGYLDCSAGEAEAFVRSYSRETFPLHYAAAATGGKGLSQQTGSLTVEPVSAQTARIWYELDAQCSPLEHLLTECLRRRISNLLIDTSEQHSLRCEICVEPEDTCGLSSLLMPWLESCFQVPGDGTMYFKLQGHPELYDFDYFSIDELMQIYYGLLEETSLKIS